MFQTTKGIVLRETEYKDNDKILTILTRDAGLVTARAWGVKRKNSTLKSGCQLLTYSEFTLQEKQGFIRVQEAVPVEMFSALRQDIVLLSLGSYFAQTAEVLSQEDSPDPALLTLVLHALHSLCVGKNPMLVKAAYEFQLAVISGYTPELSGCVLCDNETPDLFNVSKGVLQCTDCRGTGMDGLHLPISAGTLDAMRYLTSCTPEKAFSFRLGDASAAELSGITETYLLTQLERGFFTLDFYKSLLVT